MLCSDGVWSLLEDGELLVLGGLVSDDLIQTEQKVPLLGDIPVLGALFRSADYKRQQSELVIIITAHLVTPTRGEALALPTDRVRLPTEEEWERAALALEEAAAKGAGPMPPPSGNGSRQRFCNHWC